MPFAYQIRFHLRSNVSKSLFARHNFATFFEPYHQVVSNSLFSIKEAFLLILIKSSLSHDLTTINFHEQITPEQKTLPFLFQ